MMDEMMNPKTQTVEDWDRLFQGNNMEFSNDWVTVWNKLDSNFLLQMRWV